MTDQETATACLVQTALTGDKKERQAAEKQFEKIAKDGQISAETVTSLCMRLFGEEGEEGESEEEEEEEEEGEEEEFEAPGVMNSTVLAGHNEDIVLGDLEESSLSLLQVLMEDEELTESKKKKSKTSIEDQELRTTQMRLVRLLDLALASKQSAIYQSSQTVVDIGCSLLAFALDSKDEQVSQKLILTLDHHWKKHSSSACVAVTVSSEELEGTVSELGSLIANHRSLTSAALTVVARLFARILAFLPATSKQVVTSLIRDWAEGKTFRRSPGLPFFQSLLTECQSVELEQGLWTELMSVAGKSFRLKELLEIVPWKTLDYGTVQEIAVASLTRLDQLGGAEKQTTSLGKDVIKILINKHPKTQKKLLTQTTAALLADKWSTKCTQVYKNLLALDAEEDKQRKTKKPRTTEEI